MRISDWSSDVCSSDLHAFEDFLEDLIEAVEQPFVLHESGAREVVERLRRLFDHVLVERLEQHEMLLEGGRNAGCAQFVDERSEERRVGKECVGTGRSRGSPYN